MPSQAERRAATIGAILAAARRLFTDKGFDATSIDDIAEAARVAKGAVYHHFDSKEAIFTRTLEDLQIELAAAPIPDSARELTDPVDQIVAGVSRYLEAASAPEVRRILLIDGPAVIGWSRWREIDDRYFGAGARLVVAHLLGPAADADAVEANAHLLMGAVMEAALVCAVAADPRERAQTLTAALRGMLEGVRQSAQIGRGRA